MNKIPYMIFLRNDEIPEFNKLISEDEQITIINDMLSTQWFIVCLSPEELTMIKLKYRHVRQTRRNPGVPIY